MGAFCEGRRRRRLAWEGAYAAAFENLLSLVSFVPQAITLGDSLAQETDLAALIERSAAGERAAFRALYEATAARLLAMTTRILGRRDLAEEAVQEAFVSIWRRAGDFDRDQGAAFAWMATIARRRAIDRLRASPWLKRETDDAALDLAALGTTSQSGAEAIALKECLERLDPRARRSILLAYLYGMTHRELSRATGAPLGTIKSLIRRGILQLKQCLEQ